MGCDDYKGIPGEFLTSERGIKAVGQPNFVEGPSPLNPGVPKEAGQIDQTKILLKLREVDGPSPVDEILVKHLPEVVQLFRAKARDYQAEGVFTADALGAAGQFADLWRKIPKLKKAMWDREELVGEQAEEILMDFFGHVMLAIGYLNETR